MPERIKLMESEPEKRENFACSEAINSHFVSFVF